MLTDYDAFVNFLRRCYFTSVRKLLFMFIIFGHIRNPIRHTQMIVVLVLCVIPTFGNAQDTKSVLSVPHGWRVENTTYPPPWANSLPWNGKLELRFPPGFFKSTSRFFWSYPILYKLQGRCINNDAELKLALLDYDAGLYGGKYPRKQISITVQNPKHGQQRRPTSLTIKGFDPFTTNKPLTTYLEIQRRYDDRADLTTILILRSPRPADKKDPIWKSLYRFRKDAGF